MSSNYINPFFQATKDVFKMMLDIDIVEVQSENTEGEPEKQVLVVIDVTGDLSGSVTYRFPDKMPLEMVKIMSGMEMSSLDAFVTSALKEVANIISGNAMTSLSQNNYKCDITTPQVVVQNNTNCDNGLSNHRIPLQSTIGNLQIDISIKEK